MVDYSQQDIKKTKIYFGAWVFQNISFLSLLNFMMWLMECQHSPFKDDMINIIKITIGI